METEVKTKIEVNDGHNQVAGNVGVQQQIICGDDFVRKILGSKEHPITMVVTGAGVDATIGIPTSANLIPCIADFLATDNGKAIDAALRKAVGNVHFNFDKFVEQAIDNLARNLDRELATICGDVNGELQNNHGLDKQQRKLGELIVRLFHKIIDVKKNASIDEETENLIGEVLGTTVKDDTIIDFSRLNYTDTFKAVIVEILQKSMHESDNPILRHVYRNILDIEQLLSKYFYGFYEGKDGYIRTYLYISWILWAYLVSQEQHVVAAHKEDNTQPDMPDIYSQLKDMNVDLVTFCYTTFARRTRQNAYYFHGSLMQYVDVENKNDIALDDLQNIDILDFFQNQLAKEISFGIGDDKRRALPIPSFLPPLKLKPVISKHYIDMWYQTGEMMKHAKRIVLLGVSLNGIDPYFADMLRESQADNIVVVDRDIDTASKAICRIFQFLPTAYSDCEAGGHKARKFHNRLTVIEADLRDLKLAGLWC